MQLREVIHFYLGCMVVHPGLKNKRVLTPQWLQSLQEKGITVKPILRKLEDITDEECLAIASIKAMPSISDESKIAYIKQFIGGAQFYNGTSTLSGSDWVKIFRYLLSREFDLFYLIESGQAIDRIVAGYGPLQKTNTGL